MLLDLQDGFSATGCEIRLAGLSKPLKCCPKQKIVMTAFDGMVQRTWSGDFQGVTGAKGMMLILWVFASRRARWRWCYPEA
jgi:hypothetical protein